ILELDRLDAPAGYRFRCRRERDLSGERSPVDRECDLRSVSDEREMRRPAFLAQGKPELRRGRSQGLKSGRGDEAPASVRVEAHDDATVNLEAEDEGVGSGAALDPAMKPGDRGSLVLRLCGDREWRELGWRRRLVDVDRRVLLRLDR